jgi:hypothetical protein
VPKIETEAPKSDGGLLSAVGRNLGRLFSGPEPKAREPTSRDPPPRKAVQSNRFSHPPPPSGAFLRSTSTSSLLSSSSSGSLYSEDEPPYEGGQFWEAGPGPVFGGADSVRGEGEDEVRAMERQLSAFDSELSGVDAAMEKLDRLVQESEGGGAQKENVETLKKLKGEVRFRMGSTFLVTENGVESWWLLEFLMVYGSTREIKQQVIEPLAGATD